MRCLSTSGWSGQSVSFFSADTSVLPRPAVAMPAKITSGGMGRFSAKTTPVVLGGKSILEPRGIVAVKILLWGTTVQKHVDCASRRKCCNALFFHEDKKIT